MGAAADRRYSKYVQEQEDMPTWAVKPDTSSFQNCPLHNYKEKFLWILNYNIKPDTYFYVNP